MFKQLENGKSEIDVDAKKKIPTKMYKTANELKYKTITQKKIKK